MGTQDTHDIKKINALAKQILQLSHDDILIHLRFFDTALAKLIWKERPGTGCIATDGSTCFYDPVYILKKYQEEPKAVTRCYLHVLLHCIFSHGFQYNKLETDLWDLAADIAVENVILDMRLPGVTLEQDGVACFPDAPTERGVKHVEELTACLQDGYEACILFVIQMKGIRHWEPNWVTHEAFGEALCRAKEAGVRLLAYDCLVTEDSMQIDASLPIVLTRGDMI